MEGSDQGKSGDDHGEVSIDTLGAFKVLSERFLGDPGAIFDETTDLLSTSRTRVGWSEVTGLYRKLETILPSDVHLEDCGRVIFDVPKFGGALKAVSLFASPARLILHANRFGLERGFAHLRVEQSILPDKSIALSVEIPSEYEDCPQFFRITAGVMKAFPSIIGLPDATVDLQLEPRRGQYRVYPPKSQTIFAWATDCVRSLLGVNRLVEELTEQRMELNRRIRELQSVNAHLREAVEVRDRFLEVMSHELRTPLNGINGGVDLLAERAQPEDAGGLRDLRASALRLEELVSDLLEQARARAGALVIDTAEVALPRLVQETVEHYEGFAQDQRLGLSLSIAPGLPERVQADGPRLRRAIGHLLSNALKFTEDGSVKVKAIFREGKLRLEVHDTGPGVPEEIQEHIFQPFTQVANSALRRQTGMGLGLALTRAMIEAMGGRLELVQSSSAGSTFALELPVESEPVDAPPEDVDVSRPVMVVDDNRVNLRVIQRFLERLGYSVIKAENGAQALDMVQSYRPSFVIMDYEMPVMDGLSATRAIREIYPDIVILGWSASARVDVRNAMRDAGARAFLDKPIRQNGLSEALLELGIARPGSDPAS